MTTHPTTHPTKHPKHEPVAEPVHEPEHVSVPDAGVALYHDKSGPVRELQPTEGKVNFGTMTRMAREAAGLDPETGLPVAPKEST